MHNRRIAPKAEDLLNAIKLFIEEDFDIITNDMKQTIVDGLVELKNAICAEAFEFYKTNDLLINDVTKPLIDEIASYAITNDLV